MLEWIAVLALVPIFALGILMALCRPLTCPHCNRFNLLRRKRLGGVRETRDGEGIPLSIERDFRCGRCGWEYSVKRHDYDGTSTKPIAPGAEAKDD